MSFSRESKQEILQAAMEDDTQALAFMSGLFHACGQISKNGKNVCIKIVSDVQELFDYVNNITKKLYGNGAVVEHAESFAINKNEYFSMAFDIEKFRQLLLDISVIDFGQEGMEFVFDIDRNLILEDAAKRAFVKGVYVGCASSSIKLSSDSAQGTGSGYHLEFVHQKHEFLLQFSQILAEFSLVSKIFARKNSFVLYIKDAATIEDLLALVGANNSVLVLASEVVTRSLRNKVNRQVNAMSANINKTVEASMKQVHAINQIENTIGLEALSEDLQEVAVLRLANPEESLDELLKLSTIKLTRSGLAHRFRKIIKIAQTLEE